MEWSYQNNARNKNGQSNKLLETHFKETNGKTKDMLVGYDVKKDIQKLKVPNWKTFVQDRRRWKEVDEKAKTLH